MNKPFELYLFTGESCASCVSMVPIIQELIHGKENIQFQSYEIDDNMKEEAKTKVQIYEIEAVPTIVLVKDEKVLGKVKGFQPFEILELWLEAKMEE